MQRSISFILYKRVFVETMAPVYKIATIQLYVKYNGVIWSYYRNST
ncbi:hypothetical protein EYZ11_008510 [Aspergillus tanneri]|uniref:Uncharacterized protein n=1 Tax=Aspergillus tanneri TaxID=1220188 RepID=A0A4S3JFR4_9EURO|nr:hypothetical protein EYZ11_008510 [Aspergillus tanneri]